MHVECKWAFVLMKWSKNTAMSFVDLAQTLRGKKLNLIFVVKHWSAMYQASSLLHIAIGTCVTSRYVISKYFTKNVIHPNHAYIPADPNSSIHV